jgi:hypothetical protein
MLGGSSAVVRSGTVIIFELKPAPGIIKTCDLSICTTFMPFYLVALTGQQSLQPSVIPAQNWNSSTGTTTV